jgi:multicomponent Na+:H+ antiporter subunit D
MGVFLIGVGTLDAAGIAGTAIYVVADGCAKAALFACVGILQHRIDAVSQHRLFGAARGLRWTGATFVLGGLLLASLPLSGAFLGKSMVEDALVASGNGWATGAILVSSALTGGAVLLAAARVFRGAGRRPQTDRYTEEEGHEPEAAQAPRNRTPAVMIAPAVVLAAAALAIGLVPGIGDAATAAAHRFADRGAYVSEVLRGDRRPVAAIDAPPLRPLDWPLAIVSVAAAAAVAGAGLRLGPARRGSGLARAVGVVRGLHSGHVGDYVSWLVAGAATLGGLVALVSLT